MTQQITIKGISGSTANKQGQPYLDNEGRGKTRVTITCDGLPNGKKDMSTFAYQDSPVMKWQMGETHEVDITLSPDGKYVNFFPAKSELNGAQNRPAQINPVPGVSPEENQRIQNGFTAEDRRKLEAIYDTVVGNNPL